MALKENAISPECGFGEKINFLRCEEDMFHFLDLDAAYCTCKRTFRENNSTYESPSGKCLYTLLLGYHKVQQNRKFRTTSAVL